MLYYYAYYYYNSLTAHCRILVAVIVTVVDSVTKPVFRNIVAR